MHGGVFAWAPRNFSLKIKFHQVLLFPFGVWLLNSPLEQFAQSHGVFRLAISQNESN
jgi:hypothetical protein